MLNRAPFSFDVLVISLLIILPLLIYSIYLVKVKEEYKTHKSLQIVISTILGIAILIFEIDIRIRGWRHLVVHSKYYHTILWPIFYTHLSFAILTTILWGIVLTRALKRFPKIPQVSEHSRFHKKVGAWAASGLIITTITGIIFYYIAFS